MLCIALALAMLPWTFCRAQDEKPPQQESAPPPTPRPEAPTKSEEPLPGVKSKSEKEIERKEQSQRVLGVLPQFGVTSRQNAPPLTPREKFHLFARSAFDPVTMGVVGLQAALSQGENEFPAYGQGAQGYGKRFGASLADEVSAGFWSNYAYPVLLKEDPRYFRLGEGSFKSRIFYSVKQEFVCHTDNGGRTFNFSNVLGALTSGAISNLYYPGREPIPDDSTLPRRYYESERGIGLTLSRSAIALGYGTIGGLFDEFWPDIHRKLFKKREKAEPN